MSGLMRSMLLWQPHARGQDQASHSVRVGRYLDSSEDFLKSLHCTLHIAALCVRTGHRKRMCRRMGYLTCQASSAPPSSSEAPSAQGLRSAPDTINVSIAPVNDQHQRRLTCAAHSAYSPPANRRHPPEGVAESQGAREKTTTEFCIHLKALQISSRAGERLLSCRSATAVPTHQT